VRDHDVDLLVEDAIILGNGNGDEKDAEDVVAVRLERRPRLVLVRCRLEQKLERRLLNRSRQPFA
jgi:hypothetical protein